MFIKFLIPLLCLLPLTSYADDPDIREVMRDFQVEGTMIITSEDGSTTFLYNHERAHTPLCPASTFKIPNSIIALEEGVIVDQYEIIPWDGEEHSIKTWNQDHNLKSAYKCSCIWFYQELAKRIGLDAYLDTLQDWEYGNGLAGSEVTNFWLEGKGELKIRPIEQIAFLKKLYRHELPVSERTYPIMEEIMLDEEDKNFQIYAKTGAAAATEDWIGHGWYVGYIRSQGKTWFFATNILINGIEDLPKRKAVTIAAFKKKKLYTGHLY